MSWRNDEPATLYYIEALDGGDQAKEVENRLKRCAFQKKKLKFFWKKKENFNLKEKNF